MKLKVLPFCQWFIVTIFRLKVHWWISYYEASCFIQCCYRQWLALPSLYDPLCALGCGQHCICVPCYWLPHHRLCATQYCQRLQELAGYRCCHRHLVQGGRDCKYLWIARTNETSKSDMLNVFLSNYQQEAVFLVACLSYFRHPWYGDSVLDCWSTGRAIHNKIHLIAFTAELWPKIPIIHSTLISSS